jgi:hypothetical protein
MPVLFGYEKCEVFLGSKETKKLYTMNVEKGDDVREPEFFGISMKHIE